MRGGENDGFASWNAINADIQKTAEQHAEQGNNPFKKIFEDIIAHRLDSLRSVFIGAGFFTSLDVLTEDTVLLAAAPCGEYQIQQRVAVRRCP